MPKTLRVRFLKSHLRFTAGDEYEHYTPGVANTLAARGIVEILGETELPEETEAAAETEAAPTPKRRGRPKRPPASE